MSDAHHESPSRHTSGPGRLLREAREQARVSVDDLSALVKLSRNTLDALERDDFAQLNESVYVRGYYRKLAKVLPVAEADLLRAYEGQAVPKAPVAPSKLILAGGQELGSGPRVPVRVIAIIVVTGLLLGAIAFWTSRRTEQAEAPPVKPAVTAPETGAAAAPTPVASTPTAVAVPAEAAPGTTPEQQLLSSTPATAVAPATGGLSAAESAATAPAESATAVGDAKLDLSFSGTSWTEVKDARGKTLLSGVMQAGSTRSISGDAPFNVFLGNAPGVQLSFNGAKVDMSLYTRSNNTARFKLP